MKLKDFISSNELVLIAIGIFLLFPLFSNAQVSASNQSSQISRYIEDLVVNPSSANYQIQLNSKKIREFYSEEKTKYQPYWLNLNSLRPNGKAQELRVLLMNAPKHGLWNAYWVPQWQEIFDGRSVSVQDLADFEVKMSEAYLRYSHHIYFGRFDPSKIDNIDDIKISPVQMAKFMTRLKMVARESRFDFTKETNEYIPKMHEYGHLVKALDRLRNLSNKNWSKISPAGQDLVLGVDSPAIAEIRTRLSQLGYGLADNGSTRFDGDFDKALRQFQRNSSLKVDGIIGGKFSKVLNYLNVPLDTRIKQIELNLERYRWIPRKMDDRYIFVNIAMTKFTLRDNSLFVNNQWLPEAARLQFRTINGRDVRRTPLMIRKISRVEFNPTWTVPASIAIKDKLLLLKNDPTYLDKHKMDLKVATKDKDKYGNPIYVLASNPDWGNINEKDFSSGRYLIVQRPSYDNALGVVKFPLDGDSFSIYLHDTNERDLFNEENRHGSSGCVRLQRPLELAQYLLKDKVYEGNKFYNMDIIKTIVPSEAEATPRQTKVVRLNKPITVYLHYLTAEARSNGEIGFSDDDYAQDPVLLEALNLPANNSKF